MIDGRNGFMTSKRIFHAQKAQTQTVNTRLKLIQYNWIMRTYISPEKLNRFDPNIPDLCYKCNTHERTLHQYVWDCPEIKVFWSSVMHLISWITLSTIPHCLKLCLLSIDPEICALSKKERKMLLMCLLQVRLSNTSTLRPDDSIFSSNTAEVVKALKRTQMNTTPGPDNICGRILRHCAEHSQ